MWNRRSIRWLMALAALCVLGTVLLVASPSHLIVVEAKGKHPHPPHKSSESGLSVPLTAAELQTYATTHLCPCGPKVGGGYPSVLSIQKTTYGQTSGGVHNSTISLQEPVFSVELHGPFMMCVGPYGTPCAQIDNANEVFDINTGRLLQWSA